MTISELIKKLKKFNKNAEVELVHCFSEDCPVRKNGGDCVNKGCQYTIFDVINVDNSTEDKKPEKTKLISIWIEAVHGWGYDENGDLIKEN